MSGRRHGGERSASAPSLGSPAALALGSNSQKPETSGNLEAHWESCYIDHMANPQIPRDIQQQVLVKSWMDPEFRELVLRDPVQALKSLGYTVPSEMEVIVVTQPANALLLGVAANPAGSPTAKSKAGSDMTAQEQDHTSRDGTCGFICTITYDCSCTHNAICDATSKSANPNCDGNYGR